MGLDLAEVLMDIEDEFDLVIRPDTPGDFDGTVGSLIAVLYRQLQEQRPLVREQLRAFLQVNGDLVVDRAVAELLQRITPRVRCDRFGRVASSAPTVGALLAQVEAEPLPSRERFARRIKEILAERAVGRLPEDHERLIEDLGLD